MFVLFTQEECRRANFAEWIRSKEELLQPFNDKDSPVVKAGLCVVNYEQHNVCIDFKDNVINEGSNIRNVYFNVVVYFSME